jgi:hypothetical protein
VTAVTTAPRMNRARLRSNNLPSIRACTRARASNDDQLRAQKPPVSAYPSSSKSSCTLVPPVRRPNSRRPMPLMRCRCEQSGHSATRDRNRDASVEGHPHETDAHGPETDAHGKRHHAGSPADMGDSQAADAHEKPRHSDWSPDQEHRGQRHQRVRCTGVATETTQYGPSTIPPPSGQRPKQKAGEVRSPTLPPRPRRLPRPLPPRLCRDRPRRLARLAAALLRREVPRSRLPALAAGFLKVDEHVRRELLPGPTLWRHSGDGSTGDTGPELCADA